MNCEEAQRHLDDFVDGELGESLRSAVQGHLGTCLVCRRELVELRELLARAAELPREVPTRADLWPGIRLRIGAARWPRESVQRPTRGQRPWWLYLAAAGVALAALSTPISMWWLSRPAPAEPVAAGGVTRPGETAAREASPPEPPAFAMLARSEDGVLQPRIDLVDLLERRRPYLDPATADVLEEHIRIMDEAIAEIRAALEESPEDPRLLHLLATRYRQESALLQRYSHV